MKRRPGVWHGMAKAYAYGVASPLSFSTVDGKTMISSESGADVASMRAPRIISPSSVSWTMPAARYGSACCEAGRERLICGLMRVWVRQRSLSRTYS